MAVTPNIVNMPNTVKQSGPRVRTQLGVLHSAECPLKRGFPMSLTQWTIDTAVEASWHEFVGPGVVVQAVYSDYIAWHASVANWISWGTEQTGYAAFTRAQWLTKDGRDQLERLAMQWAGDAHYFGWKLSDLRWLPTSTVRAIVAGNDTTTKGFCTHAQIDPASRTDPGPNYPYDLLMQRVRAHFTNTSLQASAPKELEWSDMASKNEIRDVIRDELKRYVGDVVEVPNNQGSAESRKKNPTWTLANAVQNSWAASNAAAHDAQASRAILEKLAEKSGLTKQEIKDAVTEALAESTVDVDISVAGQ